MVKKFTWFLSIILSSMWLLLYCLFPPPLSFFFFSSLSLPPCLTPTHPPVLVCFLEEMKEILVPAFVCTLAILREVFRITQSPTSRQLGCCDAENGSKLASTASSGTRPSLVKGEEANVISVTLCMAISFFLHNKSILALFIPFLPVSSGSVWMCMICS